ncbi:MAG: hypothetical protein GY839_04925 [candidate division Zixibacteria bacterium]|nr:hypothetical protein [candidate division Zixibacteria bacterium]
MKNLLSIFAAVIGLCVVVSATIINVPADQATIQLGIDASANGDTVLVQPDTYFENINFNGHNIVLGSLYLTAEDTSYISQTIIDGDSAGTVVTFETYEDTTAIITGFTIQHGRSGVGGGIICENASPKIIFNSIIYNSADLYNNKRGGGIYCAWSDAIISFNNISDNYSRSGGGIYVADSNPLISNNRINSNIGYNWGGGIGLSMSNSIISNNIIEGNTAEEGGGIRVSGSSSLISNKIRGNTAVLGGGIYMRWSSSTLICENTVKDNYAEQGGGFYCYHSNPQFDNNLIVENQADSSGGGFYFNQTTNFELTNNNITNNSSNAGAGGIMCDSNSAVVINNCIIRGNSGQQAATDITSILEIEYSNVESGFTGDGNIDTDPLFRDPANGDYHLMAIVCGDPYDSPCIDAGNPVITDTLIDCSWGLGTSHSDMGAYAGGLVSITNITRNVPGEYLSIQEAIDACVDRDTVLVQPGLYVENINFKGRNIVLASLYLTTGDTSFISSTIIDGDSSGSVVTMEFGEDSTTVLTGFTIQNGYAENGGGVYCFSCEPDIYRNKICYNTAENGGGLYGRSSRLQLTSCVIFENIAEKGGGTYAYGNPPIIDSCVIENNTAIEGGGVYRDAYITNSIISSNTAENGGGIYGSHSPSIYTSIIDQNSASVNGGGIYVSNHENIVSCIISSNTAGQNGGGIYANGGYPCPYIASCLFTENRADGNGGAIDYHAFDAFLQILHSTFYRNVAQDTGGAINGSFDQVQIYNCIFWADSASQMNELHDYVGGVNYCDIQGGWEGYGNIDCPPLFCDPDSGNFNLAENSCCAGAGEDGTDIGAYGVGCPAIIYEYLPGDANMYNGIWPPMVIGGDVTYLVSYFRGPVTAPPCLLDGFWASSDANGDCVIIGSDVTKLVNYFRGQTSLSYCHEYPPAWLTTDDCPTEAPPGWPNCE